PGAGRRAGVVGGPAGPAGEEGREAPGRARRGPPARVRHVRGADPRGPLWRRPGPDLRPRDLRGARVDRLEGDVPGARRAVPGSGVSPGEDVDRLAGLAVEAGD